MIACVAPVNAPEVDVAQTLVCVEEPHCTPSGEVSKSGRSLNRLKQISRTGIVSRTRLLKCTLLVLVWWALHAIVATVPVGNTLVDKHGDCPSTSFLTTGALNHRTSYSSQSSSAALFACPPAALLLTTSWPSYMSRIWAKGQRHDECKQQPQRQQQQQQQISTKNSNSNDEGRSTGNFLEVERELSRGKHKKRRIADAFHSIPVGKDGARAHFVRKPAENL